MNLEQNSFSIDDIKKLLEEQEIFDFEITTQPEALWVNNRLDTHRLLIALEFAQGNKETGELTNISEKVRFANHSEYGIPYQTHPVRTQFKNWHIFGNVNNLVPVGKTKT